MPVPASEGENALDTPEILSRDELFGLFGGKMDTQMAGFSGNNNMPRGSFLGANSTLKFDPELTNEDETEATKPSFNPDIFLNLDDNNLLPFSSQETDGIEDLINCVINDDVPMAMPVEEVNDGGASDAASPFPDLYSSLTFSSVNNARCATDYAAATSSFGAVDTKPDIVKNALNEALVTPEELAQATFIMVEGNNGDAALNAFQTVDTSALFDFPDNDVKTSIRTYANNNKNNNNFSANIPLPVYQTSDSEAITCDFGFAAQEATSSTVDAAVASTSKRVSRKRKAPASVVDADLKSVFGDENHVGNPEYRDKRNRNNEAVRKSRAKAKERQHYTEEECVKLREENEKKAREIEGLQRELNVYKELIKQFGFQSPKK